jgi:cytoskeleton protein RodZ
LQSTGIGPTLREARLLRGKSIEEASRETRIRADYLQALERERFDSLRGDVYVRGCLRSYSTYLGVDADTVLTVYHDQLGTNGAGRPEAPSVRPMRPERAPLRERIARVPTWPVLAVVAVAVLAGLGAAGLFSRGRSAPIPESLTQAPAFGVAGGSSVTVALRARVTVHAAVSTDRQAAYRFVLRPGESRTFQGVTGIDVVLDSGGTTDVIVNGHPIGTPGVAGVPYRSTFVPQDYRSSPSGNSR